MHTLFHVIICGRYHLCGAVSSLYNTNCCGASSVFHTFTAGKLPELNDKILQDGKMRERNVWLKVKDADYYNKRNNAQVNDLDPYEIVLLKHKKENKLTSEFEVTKYQVINRIGNIITTKIPTGNTFTRNVSMVKRFVFTEVPSPIADNLKCNLVAEAD